MPRLVMSAAGSLGLLPGAAEASLVLADPGGSVVVSFDDFDGSGLSATPAAGQLDSDTWRVTGMSTGEGTFGGTWDTGDFAQGSSAGAVSGGGVYAFDVSNGDPDANMALGVQPTGSVFTDGSFTLRVLNDTGMTIDDLTVAYDVLVFNDQGRANGFDFAWSLDDLRYTDVPVLDLVSPEAADAAPAWQQHGRSVDLGALGLADGAFMYLRWTGSDVSGSGSRDQFALDGVTLTTVPGPGAGALLAVAGLVGVRRRRGRRRR